MAQEVFLRANAGIISADKFNDNISPFKPTRHAATAVFIREEQYINPQTSPSLGSTVRFEVNKDGDYLVRSLCGSVSLTLQQDKVWMVVSMAALTKNAGATFARYCDWLGYALIRQLRLIYGPTILQVRLYLPLISRDSVYPRKELGVGHRALCVVAHFAARKTVLWGVSLCVVFAIDAVAWVGRDATVVTRRPEERDRVLLRDRPVILSPLCVRLVLPHGRFDGLVALSYLRS
jgi:hypothetical protein